MTGDWVDVSSSLTPGLVLGLYHYYINNCYYLTVRLLVYKINNVLQVNELLSLALSLNNQIRNYSSNPYQY